MKSTVFGLILASGMFLSQLGYASLKIGEVPPQVKLEGDLGGLVSGEKWDSSDLPSNNKVSIIFYVAPSEKDLNKAASDAIRDAQFDRSKYKSYAIINMAASSWPNFLIASKIKASQEEFPTTTYVKDVKRSIVEKWGVKDNSNDVIILDKQGKVAFYHFGKLEEKNIQEMIKAIRVSL